MDDDAELLTTSHGIMYTQRAETRRRRVGVRLVAELVLAVGFVASISCAIGLGAHLRALKSSNTGSVSPECLHALGGGPVASGEFPNGTELNCADL